MATLWHSVNYKYCCKMHIKQKQWLLEKRKKALELSQKLSYFCHTGFLFTLASTIW